MGTIRENVDTSWRATLTHLNVLAAIRCNSRDVLAHGTYICPVSDGRINRGSPKVGTSTYSTWW